MALGVLCLVYTVLVYTVLEDVVKHVLVLCGCIRFRSLRMKFIFYFLGIAY